MKIYVASSWRNDRQPSVVESLRERGHEVYDFRNPEPGDTGFAWSDIDPEWQSWGYEAYLKSLRHPVAQLGFAKDRAALDAADACVLVMPCGRSAHLELGYVIGAGKPSAILLEGSEEPELMYLLADFVTASLDQLCSWAGRNALPQAGAPGRVDPEPQEPQP